MEKTYGRRGVSTIDPMFFIPEGVDELSYEGDNFFDEDVSLDTSTVSGPDEDEDGLEVPKITSITQKVRKTKAGMDVVDVIFEVQDIEGVKDFEIRVAKA